MLKLKVACYTTEKKNIVTLCEYKNTNHNIMAGQVLGNKIQNIIIDTINVICNLSKPFEGAFYGLNHSQFK